MTEPSAFAASEKYEGGYCSWPVHHLDFLVAERARRSDPGESVPTLRSDARYRVISGWTNLC
jgi:hypothetical protein